MNPWQQQVASIARQVERNAYLASLPAGARAMAKAGDNARSWILAVLRSAGPMRIMDIADEIGLGQESTRGHLVRMAADRLVEQCRNKTWRIRINVNKGDE